MKEYSIFLTNEHVEYQYMGTINVDSIYEAVNNVLEFEYVLGNKDDVDIYEDQDKAYITWYIGEDVDERIETYVTIENVENI